MVGELGELVITAPMPSMPVGFWGDPDGHPLPGHLLRRLPRACGGTATGCGSPTVGSAVIAGRSDATLNRGGVRLGTAEFYRVVEELPEVADSLVVHLEDPAGGNGELLLVVQLRDGRRAGRRAAPPDRHRAAHRAVAPAHPGRDRRGAGGPAQPDRQEAGAAGQADPARRARSTTSPAATCSPTRPRSTPFVALAAARAGVDDRAGAAGRRGRHRGDRGQLGGALPGPRPRRRRHRPGAGRRGAAARRRRRALADARGRSTGASPDRLTFTADAAEAVADADFVQENGPEREDVKHALFAVLDAAARPEVVLAVELVGAAAQRDRARLPARTRSGCWSGTRSTRRT